MKSKLPSCAIVWMIGTRFFEEVEILIKWRWGRDDEMGGRILAGARITIKGGPKFDDPYPILPPHVALMPILHVHALSSQRHLFGSRELGLLRVK